MCEHNGREGPSGSSKTSKRLLLRDFKWGNYKVKNFNSSRHLTSCERWRQQCRESALGALCFLLRTKAGLGCKTFRKRQKVSQRCLRCRHMAKSLRLCALKNDWASVYRGDDFNRCRRLLLNPQLALQSRKPAIRILVRIQAGGPPAAANHNYESLHDVSEG